MSCFENFYQEKHLQKLFKNFHALGQGNDSLCQGENNIGRGITQSHSLLLTSYGWKLCLRFMSSGQSNFNVLNEELGV